MSKYKQVNYVSFEPNFVNFDSKNKNVSLTGSVLVRQCLNWEYSSLHSMHLGTSMFSRSENLVGPQRAAGYL